jgi:hypothetical protein
VTAALKLSENQVQELDYFIGIFGLGLEVRDLLVLMRRRNWRAKASNAWPPLIRMDEMVQKKIAHVFNR